MTIRTYSSRDFARDVGAAKRAAAKGPVFISHRGRPAYALLAIDDYHRLAGQPEVSLLQAMQAIDGGSGIDFDPPRLQIKRKAVRLG